METPKSALTRIPLEILIHITNSLDPVSALCFSLTCKWTYLMLRNQCIRYVPKPAPHLNYQKRDLYWNLRFLDFLLRLERDLPDHITCHHCFKLHTIRRIGRYVLDDDRSEYGTCLDQEYIVVPLRVYCADTDHDPVQSLTIAFPAVQMAMKLWRQKRVQMASTLDLFSRNVKSSHWHSGEEWRAVYTLKAKIIDGSFFLRVQETHIFPQHQLIQQRQEQEDKNREDKEDDKKEIKHPIPGYWQSHICNHYRPLRNYLICPQNQTINLDYEMHMWDDLPTSHGQMGKLMACRICWTDFRVEWKDLNIDFEDKKRRQETALVFTKWINLGKGEDPLYDDEWHSSVESSLWQNERLNSLDIDAYDLSREYALEGLQPYSIYNAFEGDVEFDVGSLLTEGDLRYLFE